MRQNYENRGGIELTSEGYVVADKLAKFKINPGEGLDGVKPVIAFPSLMIGANSSLWSDLEKWRVASKLDQVDVYITTWNDDANLFVLNNIAAAQKREAPNFYLHIRTFDYTTDFALFCNEFIEQFDGVVGDGIIRSSVIKRLAAPYLLHQLYTFIDELEEEDVYVIKSRSVIKFTEPKRGFHDALKLQADRISSQETTESIVNGDFGRRYVISQSCSRKSINETVFSTYLSTGLEIFSNRGKLLENLFKGVKSEYVKSYPTKASNVNDYLSYSNMLLPYEGTAWFGNLLNIYDIEYKDDQVGLITFAKVSYKCSIPAMEVRLGTLYYNEKEMYECTNNDKLFSAYQLDTII